MIKKVVGCLILSLYIFSASSLALPYFVEEDLLIEQQELQELYQQQPSSNETIFELAMSYAYTGQVDLGMDLFKTLSPNYSEVVVENYTTQIEINSENWKSHFKLAFGLYFSNQEDKESSAIKQFEIAINLNPNNIWSYGFIALIHNQNNNPKEALMYCKRALDIEPNATAIYALQADAYRKQKKYIKAIRSFLKFQKLYGKHK